MGFWQNFLDPQVPANLSDSAKAQRKTVLEQKGKVTSRISESTRTIAFGVLASSYALLLANEKLAPLFGSVRWMLLMAALAALLAVISDALQYTFGFINAQQALASEDQLYPKNWSRNGRQICFLLKQAFAYLAGGLLIAAICVVLARTGFESADPPANVHQIETGQAGTVR